MATQNVNIGVNISDNGTANKTLKNVKDIHSELKATQKTAQQLSISSPGGTPGSRAVYSKAAPQGSEKMMSGEDYGRARGSAGATGASARDFANQAQGLGGLVRLYATYAANLFAVGAAFTALKSAADTTNLVKGLNTLGAASGQSLGSLSKRLVEVTDGAVSMREAMEATAKASSAGMSSKDIERLGLVAKNASLALGVSMPDALSRISRGIVKLEPELLDELGLFTKIGPATEKYALEIGKSASSLTDFERRQAFANAVLAEGEKKFGALAEAAANPYDKLLSSLKNILSSGGDLINKVLTPIISLLANSPTALTAVLTGIGYVLLKQALPAIGQLRAGLRSTAEDALKSAEAFKSSFGDEFQSILERRFKIPDLEAGVRKAQTDLAKLTVPSKVAGSVTKLAEGDVASLKNVEAVLARKNALVEASAAGTRKVSDTQVAAAKQEILYINAVINLLQKKQALEAGEVGALGVASKDIGRFDPETIALEKYDKLRSKVDQANAISNAAQVAGVAGIRSSWSLLNKEVAEKNITGFAKYSTLTQGGLAAIGTRLMGIVGSLGAVGQVIGLAVAGFTLLDGWLSKNTKQAEKFNSALTTAEESVANVARTITAATTIEGISTATIANTVAFSNALNGLSGSLVEIIKLARETDRASGKWDNFWDSIFSVVDKDRASKLAKSVASQIQSSIRLLSREGLAEEYSEELRKILQVEDLGDFDKVATAFKNLRKDQQDAVVAIQNNSTRALGNAGAALQSFKDKTDEALKAQKVLSNTFLDTSPAFKYGESLLAVSDSLAKLEALGPERVAQALEEISTNLEKGAMFGKDFVAQFTEISSQFLTQKQNIDASKRAITEYGEQAEKARKKLTSLTPLNLASGTQDPRMNLPNVKAAQQDTYNISELQRMAARALASAPREAVDQGLKIVSGSVNSLFEKGIALINKSITNAQNAAAITIGKALTSNLTGPQKLVAEAAYAQQELKARLADIQISEDMLDTQNQLVNEMKLANALQAEANILQKNAGKTGPEVEKQNIAASKTVALARGALGDTSGLDAQQKADLQKDLDKSDMLKKKGTQAARIAVGAQMTATQLGLKGELPVSQLAQEEELKKITDKTTASLIAKQNVLSSIASVSSAENIISEQNLELTQKALQQDRELGDINAKIAQAESKYFDARDDITRKGQQDEINFLEQKKQRTEEAQAADTSFLFAKNKQQLLAQELSNLDKRYESLRSTADLENQIASGRLEAQSQLLGLQATANQYSQEYVISAQSALDKEKLLLDTTTAREQAEATLAQKREAAEARIAVLKLDNSEKSKILIAVETAELTRQETLTKNTIAGLTNQFNTKSAILNKTKEINLEQDRYNELLGSSTQLASALGNAFGELGTKLGSVASSLAEIAVSSAKGAKALADLEFDRDAENDPKKRALLEKEVAKQQEKNTKGELSGYAKVAGAAKSLFKEKTAAYKILAATEKAMQIATLVMEAKTFAMKMGWLGTEVATTVGAETAIVAAKTAAAPAKVAADVPGILSSFANMGPVGYAIGAALVASLLAMVGGGGGSKAAFVPTAEQRQETQGTAMGYDSSGNKVQVRRGVFGDTEAKSESIAKSLERIKETSVEGLNYDNKVVSLLTSIDNGINKASKNLYGIAGLRTGSMFGTVEGSSGGGFLSSKTSRSIRDSGLIIEGTFAQLASDTNKSVLDFFEQVTVSKRSWYGSKKTWIETYRKEVDNATSEFFQGVFGDATSLFVEVGKLAGINKDTIDTALGSFDVTQQFVSLRGLKGEDFQKELGAIISSILDDASSVIFSSFEKFADFGEGMTETVIRVIDNNEKVRQQVRNLMREDIEDTLSGRGVIPEYKEIVSYRLKALDNATTSELKAASKIAEISNSIFSRRASIVNKLSVQATQEDLENIYDAGYSFVEKTVTVISDGIAKSFADADIKQTSYTITENLIALAGGLEEFLSQSNFFRENFLTEAERLIPVQRAVIKEMARLGFASVDTKAEFKDLVQSLDLTDSNAQKTYQSLMNLAPGFNDVIEGVEAQSTALKDAAQSFRSFIQQIKEFKSSLLLGASSTLTPAEKYAEAKSQFDIIYAQALAGDQAAMSKVTSSAQSFLDASKTYFASSEAYTTDFNTVLNKLDEASISAGASASVAELQLNALSIHTELLSSINTNIALIAGVPALAGGGRARGLTLVGEMGPELVDFTNPGRVYTADQTAGMFTPLSGNAQQQQLIQEVKNLRQEVTKLRDQQSTETGHLINATYDAQARNAEQVTEGVTEAAAKQAWADNIRQSAIIS